MRPCVSSPSRLWSPLLEPGGACWRAGQSGNGGRHLCRKIIGCVGAVVGLACFPHVGRAQGTIIFHNTGGGQTLISEQRSILVDASLPQPRIVFDFGFATDEVPTPGGFLDSFTVTLQDSAQRFSAVYLTADASGIAWAPQTPGGIFLDPASILTTPLTYPGLQPVLANRNAFQVSAPIPAEFLGMSVNVFFDLFDNLDANASQGWFSGLSIAAVPEPQTWVLLLTGAALLWCRPSWKC